MHEHDFLKLRSCLNKTQEKRKSDCFFREHISQRREKENLFFSVDIASSLTLDSLDLERLSSRVLGMKQKRCNLLKARLSENDFQLSSLDERNSSSYVRNMLMAQMNPIVGYNQ